MAFDRQFFKSLTSFQSDQIKNNLLKIDLYLIVYFSMKDEMNKTNSDAYEKY